MEYSKINLQWHNMTSRKKERSGILFFLKDNLKKNKLIEEMKNIFKKILFPLLLFVLPDANNLVVFSIFKKHPFTWSQYWSAHFWRTHASTLVTEPSHGTGRAQFAKLSWSTWCSRKSILYFFFNKQVKWHVCVYKPLFLENMSNFIDI